MTENYLDILKNQKDIDLIIKPKSDPDRFGRTPFSCPYCEEIRGAIGKGTQMSSGTEEMMWRSFGMCSACYGMTRDHPEQVEINKQEHQKRLDLKNVEEKKLKELTSFRVYFKDSKACLADFVNSIQTFVVFYKYPGIDKDGKLINKSKGYVTEEVAQKVVEIIHSKDIEAWYDKSPRENLTLL
jgi:hypothetical protein